MSEKRVLEILRSCDALLEGHFRYTSGRHGSQYFEKIRIVREPRFVDELGRMMAALMSDIRDDIDLVCAPAPGGLSADMLDKVVGKRLRYSLSPQAALTFGMLEC